MSARAGVARRLRPWRAALAAAWLACLAPAVALAAVDVPTLAAHVTDRTGTLAAADIARLEQRLVALEQRKGSQVAILLVATTQPETIEGYALEVAEKTRLGRAEPDDGLLLLVAKDDRKARLEVGRGLEGAIPDAIASRIIREYLAPKFREDDYAGGLEDAVVQIEKLIDGEPLPPPMEAGRASDDGGLAPALLIGFFVGVFAASTRLRPKVLRMVGAGGVAAVAVLVLLGAGFGLVVAAVVAAIVSMVAGGGRYIGHGGGGGWGGGGFGGGGWGGGSGGGGWSGGGGSFGGGGASGGW